MNKSPRLPSLAAHGLQPLAVAKALLKSRLLGRHLPFWVNVEVTHRCNLRCSFCDKSDPTNEMPGAKARTLLRELRTCGTGSISLDGGEPLSHPEIESIVACAKREGLRVALSTNGTLLSDHREVLTHIDAVKISIDGPRAVHDAIRGEGMFDRAIEGARIARSAGVALALRMTLADGNVEHWRYVADLAEQLGASALFQPAIGSVSDAFVATAPHCASVDAYRHAIDEIIRRKNEGAPIGNEYVCLDHLRHWPDPTPVKRCAGGRVEVAIGPDGSMFPCGRVGRDEPAPNVFELGVAAAFAKVRRPTGCTQCWCTLTLGNGYLYALDVRLLQGRVPGLAVGTKASLDRDSPLPAQSSHPGG